MYFLEGETSEFFPIKLGVAQGCTLSPTLFLIYINGQFCEMEKYPKLGDKLSENTLFELLFVDDFVEVAGTGSALQKLTDIVHN